MKPQNTSGPTAHARPSSVPASEADTVRQVVKGSPASSRTPSRIPWIAHSYKGLIPPHEMFGHLLPGRFIPDADSAFEERTERAWEHVNATRFTSDEYASLREALVRKIEKELRNLTGNG